MISKNNSKKLSYFCFSLFLGLLLSHVSALPVLGGKIQTLAADEIRENAKQFLLGELAWNTERMEIQVEYRGGDLTFPKGQLVWDFNLPGRKKRIGQVPFQLTLKQDGRILRQMRLKAQVQVTYTIFKTNHSLKRGHVLEMNDVKITEVQSRKMLRNMVWMEKNTLVARSPVLSKPTTRPKPINLLSRTPTTFVRSLILAAPATSAPRKNTNKKALSRMKKVLRNIVTP